MSVWQNRVNSYISHTAFNDRKKGLMISADGLQYTDLRALKLELYTIPKYKNYKTVNDIVSCISTVYANQK